MTPAEALNLALDKERTAVELYKELAGKHSEIRDLLSELLTQEEIHVKKITKKISEITRI